MTYVPQWWIAGILLCFLLVALTSIGVLAATIAALGKARDLTAELGSEGVSRLDLLMRQGGTLASDGGRLGRVIEPFLHAAVPVVERLLRRLTHLLHLLHQGREQVTPLASSVRRGLRRVRVTLSRTRHWLLRN